MNFNHRHFELLYNFFEDQYMNVLEQFFHMLYNDSMDEFSRVI